MNTTILARNPPALFLCPKSSNKQGEELMNDIFENTETMQETSIPVFTAESVMRGHPDKKLCDLIAETACWTPVCSMIPPAAWPVR